MRSNVEIAFGGTTPLLELIDLLYAAVQQEELWPLILEKISDHLQGESLVLFAASPNDDTPGLLQKHEMDEAAWAQFTQHYAAINPIMQRCEQAFSPNETWMAHQVITDRELEKSEFYNDFFLPNDMHHSVGIRLVVPGLPLANLSCQRPKESGTFGQHADIVMQTLRPHLMRVLSLRHQLGSMQASIHGLELASQKSNHGVLILTADRRIALTNRIADRLLQDERNGLRVTADHLTLWEPAEDEQLGHLLRNARTATPSDTNSMLLRSANSKDISLTVLPLPAGDGTRCLLLFAETQPAANSRAAILRQLYNLTPTEGRLADALLNGLDITEAAESLRFTRETARFHLKRIFTKTGVNRQAELIRLAMSLPNS